MSRRNVLVMTETCAALVLALTTCVACQAEIISVGKASYTDSLTDFDPEDHGPKFEVYVSDDVPRPLPTSDWWTTLLTERYSKNLFAFPMAFRCDQRGLLVDRPEIEQTKLAVLSPFKPDLRVGLKDQKFDRAEAAGWGDFTVDIGFRSDEAQWKATIGHGLPFAYATFKDGTPEVSFLAKAEVVEATPDALWIRVDGKHDYGLYFVGGGKANTGRFEKDSVIELPECTYLAVAALPDKSSFEDFRVAAFQRVTGSRVDYQYDMPKSAVTTTYRVETKSMKGESAPSFLALFPHHYKNQNLDLTEQGYDSLRGRLKLVHADEFQTTIPFHGLMPFFPEPTSATYDKDRLNRLLDKIVSNQNLFTDSKDELVVEAMESGSGVLMRNDTYFGGKQIAHISRLIPIADNSGNLDARNKLIAALRNELVDWFTATPGEKDHYFYYDRKSGGLIGMNASFYAYDYTDHHFHYAHFVYAAAILSLYDSDFKDDYGPMVEMLIHDYNSPERGHSKFPHLRMMDPYEGHCWANGRGGWGEGLEDDGNDQESSSEAMHSWQAIALWGMVTENTKLRDHGIWGYVTEACAINQYYFDVDDDIYPNDGEFDHQFVSLLLGGKAAYSGYNHFSEYIFGIQYLPITPSALYLGYNTKHVRRQYEDFVKENGGVEDKWFDLLWVYQSFYDPAVAIEKFDESVTIDLDGNSFANVYHWLHFMSGVGTVDVSITAPWPYYSAFRKDDQITVMVYNPGKEEVEIPISERGSDRAVKKLTVRPGEIAVGVIEANGSK